ncbi:acetylornithine deacetylase or succinyl-diaminopimelate desuccinylase, putative [Babesia ovata]|uniref:Acetylornithine deacetylase or succinyl-diaminopimelate desuccinylase, putative n=1 Tax=Babesia ovata TaxID=189622 RepID=A0A2H6KC58_9APIC|nr:acetylornithine deacetylase or succinyl-diaminopimelate desuccinylase, putative [Babesia ovata]GBE60575.1 acetylornithine deacetylase or succinyl-diaminopimelate desuccinylase, putative [Babesia ovata]
MDSIELMLDDQKYVTNTLPYHIYMICVLGRAGHRSTVTFMERSLRNPITLLSPSSACQLLFAISLIIRESGEQVAEDHLGSLLRHMNSCYKRLSLSQQEELHEALLVAQKYEELPDGLSHFVASKIPSRLPTMCRGETDLQLDAIEGVSYVFIDQQDVSRTALVCVGESEALTVLDGVPSVSVSPRAQQYFRTLELLFSKKHSHGCVPSIAYNVSTNLSHKLVF